MTPSDHETDKPRLPIDILEDGLNYVLTSGTQTAETDPEVLASLAALGINTGPSSEDVAYVTSVMHSILPTVEYIHGKIQEKPDPDEALVKQSERYSRVIEASKTIFEDMTEVVSVPAPQTTPEKPKRKRPSGKRPETLKLSDKEQLTEEEQIRVTDIILKKSTDKVFRNSLIAAFKSGKAEDRKRSSEDGIFLRKAFDKVVKDLYEKSEDGIITKKVLTELLIPKTYPKFATNKKKVRAFVSVHFFGGRSATEQTKRETFMIKVGERKFETNQWNNYQPKPEFLYTLSPEYAEQLGVELKTSE